VIALLRDPLVHFLALGLLIFAFTPAPSTAPAESTVIEVDDVLIQDLRALLGQRLERLPTPEELTREVDAWIDQEILVRTARSQGLDRGDPQIRERLAERMAFVLGAREVPQTPDEATLRALYDARKAAFRVALQVTLRQCFAGADRARADTLLAAAEAGATRAQLAERCDPPPGGPVLRGRSKDRLVKQFGPAFIEDLDTTPVGAWHLRQSTRGWHVVRIEHRRDGRPIPFEAARGRLIAAWRRQQTADARRTALDALRTRYQVRGWPR
jgi:hypothetical protein